MSPLKGEIKRGGEGTYRLPRFGGGWRGWGDKEGFGAGSDR